MLSVPLQKGQVGGSEACNFQSSSSGLALNWLSKEASYGHLFGWNGFTRHTGFVVGNFITWPWIQVSGAGIYLGGWIHRIAD